MAKKNTNGAAGKSVSPKVRVSSILLSFTNKQLAVAAVFVLVFSSAGSWLLYKSYAAAWYCTGHMYYQNEPGTYHGYCVYQIQDSMQTLGFYFIKNTTMQHAAPDGIYGQNTAAGVKAFQNWYNHQHSGLPVVRLYPDGVIGSSTWNALCPTLKHFRQNYLYNNLGCYHTPYGSARV